MRKNLHALLATLAFIGFLCGCATPKDDKSIELAVSQSNVEARRLYQVEPFKRDDGKLWMAGNHWVWDAKANTDGHDYKSHVVFDRNNAVAEVHVERN